MSVLSALESAVSYIGFIFGAPSISSPLDAKSLALTAQAALVGDEDRSEFRGMKSIDLPLRHGAEENYGFGFGERMSSNPPPGLGHVDHFGKLD